MDARRTILQDHERTCRKSGGSENEHVSPDRRERPNSTPDFNGGAFITSLIAAHQGSLPRLSGENGATFSRATIRFRSHRNRRDERRGRRRTVPIPHLFTHESYVDDVLRAAKLPIDDPLAMSGSVLGALPDRVKVYPTENYYYFKFVYGAVTYAGNIRLDIEDRDAGRTTLPIIRT